MTSVRTRPRTLGGVPPGLLAPAVIAVVLGILGMHGVDAHGVNMHGAVAHAEPATPSLAAMPAHELAADEHGHSPAKPATSPGEHASGAMGDAGVVSDPDGMSGMAMLCVAMLAGAAAAVLALLVPHCRLPRVWAVLQLARRVLRPAPRTLRVGTGPPHVWRFSVIRC